MLYFKSCPKCATGTIERNHDAHGEYAQCLNCGFMRDVHGEISGAQFKKLLSGWKRELAVKEPDPGEAVA